MKKKIILLLLPLSLSLFSCGNNEHTHTFSDVFKHNDSEHWKEATCEHIDQIIDKGEHTFVDGVCSICGYIRHVHTFSNTYSSDKSFHWKKATCEHTDLISDKESHDFDDNNKCKICGYERIIEHIHSFDTNYTYDENKHWQKANCEHSDLKQNEGEHTYSNNVCTICGYCKPIEHTHTFDDKYTYDEAAHWHKATCEHNELVNDYGNHTFMDNVCTICGYIRHVHTFDKNYSYDNLGHFHKATCEHTNIRKDYEAHIYKDDKCIVCGMLNPIEYNEEEDSLDGVDASDLTNLYDAFNKIGNNYTLRNNSHFSEGGLKIYKRNYGNDYSNQTIRMFDDTFMYTYSSLDEYKHLDKYNKIYFINNGSKQFAIAEKNLLTIDAYTPSLKEDDGKYPFSLIDVTKDYLDKHTFSRASKNKFICEEDEVIFAFLDLCCPYLQNEGYYMTYRKISFELDDDNNLIRIRIYASPTQIGKLTYLYRQQDYKNWYLLFNETNIECVGTTSLPCLNNF